MRYAGTWVGCCLILSLLLQGTVWAGPGNPLTRIAEINRLKDKARSLIQDEQYVAAAQVYELLIAEYGLNEGGLLINRANLYFLAAEPQQARTAYQETVLQASEGFIRSRAYNQLGLLAIRLGQEDKTQALHEALELFKQALKANHKNNAARKNYEMVYRLLNNFPEQEEQKNEENPDEDSSGEDPPPERPEPSDYAKSQKARADRLVSEGHYGEAYNLMTEALAKDPSVQAYQDYINRLGDIANIVD